MRRTIAALVALMLVGSMLTALPTKAHAPGVVLYGRGTATIDGVISPGEWNNAGNINFTVNTPHGGTTPGTLSVMNDGNNLYFAVQFARATNDLWSYVAFYFDNDNSGGAVADGGDDEFVFGSDGNFYDDYRIYDPVHGHNVSFFDTDKGGTNDGTGAVGDEEELWVYELSRPLDSTDDAHDFSLHPGNRVGFMLNVGINAGSAWPDDYGYTYFPTGAVEDWKDNYGDIVIVPCTIWVRASDNTGPPGKPIAASIVWSGTTPAQGGTNNTPFPVITDGGSVTVAAPLTSNNQSLNFFVFRNWVVITPQPYPQPPIVNPQPTDQKEITFAATANKTAVAIYKQIFNLGNIVSNQPNVKPVGISHSVWVNTGVPVVGVRVNFLIQPGPNSAASGSAYTDPTGKATFTYTGINDGQDIIWAYLDSNGNGAYDSGEPRTNNTINISWVKNFVTGGGNIKVDGKVTWTFDGTVGVLPEGGVVGEFNLVDKVNGLSYHLGPQFGFFGFSGGETESPPVSRNTARFRGFGTRSDGAAVTIVIMIQDVAEPGAGLDRIAAVLVSVNNQNVGQKLIGSVSGIPEFSSLPQEWWTISGGNFQVHDMNLSALSSPGRIILIKQTNPAGANGFLVTMSYGPQVSYPNGLQMSDGFQVDSGFILAPSIYTITELPTAGWSLTSIDINDPSGGSSSSGGTATINLAPGETVIVTYKNTKNT